MQQTTTKIPKGYKQTEIGVIPEDWKIRRLGDVASLKRGKFTPRPRNNPIYYGGAIPFVQTGDVTNSNGKILAYTQTLNEEGLAVSALFKKGIILMTIAANVGYSGILQIDMACPDSLVAIDGLEIVNNAYLNYYFSFKRQELDSLSTSGAQKNLNIELLALFQIPLPPTKSEQIAIATVLFDNDALIESLEKLIAKKKAIKQGAMQQLLTGKKRLPGFSGDWEVKKLGDFLDYEQPTEYLVTDTEYNDNNQTPVLTAGKTFILGYTNEEQGIFNKLPVIIFDDFTTAIKFVNFPFKAKSSAMKMLVPKNDKVNMRFIYELMLRIKYPLGDHKRHWIGECQHFEITVPESLNEQTAIATILSDMDAEIESLEQKRDKYTMIKQGMMQELLTGKTRLV